MAYVKIFGSEEQCTKVVKFLKGKFSFTAIDVRELSPGPNKPALACTLFDLHVRGKN